ncbi:MAG: hypothetical protein HFI68_05680 [Lachnospiraceae bacterium]|nr:hypothetical protein [Lachnospiraceae bacterium]
MSIKKRQFLAWFLSAIFLFTIPAPAIYAAENTESEPPAETQIPEESKTTGETQVTDESKAAATVPAAEESKVSEETQAPTESKATDETQASPETNTSEESKAPAETKASAEIFLSPAPRLEDKSAGLKFQFPSELPKTETTYSAGSGTMTWVPVLDGQNVTGGTLILKNAVIDAESSGIWICVPVTIRLEGTNQITAAKSNTNGSGLYLTGSERSTVTGSGSLKIISGGNGIQSPGGITLDETNLSIAYASNGAAGCNGIWSSYDSIIIQNNSHVKITGSGSIGAVQIQNAHDIIVEDSELSVINSSGEAIQTTKNIQFTNSHVCVVGNTDSGNVSGSLSYRHLTIDNSSLYAENTSSGDDVELPLSPGNTEIKNGSALYTKKMKYLLYLQGDGIWYGNCSYDQSAGQVTSVGTGHVVGDVVWDSDMEGKSLAVGRYYNASLTVPEGETAKITASASIDIYSANGNSGSLVNNGTVQIEDGGSLYSIYNKSTQTGGTIQNHGNIRVASKGLLQNQNRLENDGSIVSAGNFSHICLTGYNAVLQNTGSIDGFVIEMYDDTYINKANGTTVIETGQTLTLGDGASGAKDRILQVEEGAVLTVEEGAVVDARTNVTSATLSHYLDVSDTLVLDGILLLPENTPDKTVRQLGQLIKGNGSIRVGDGAGSSSYYIVDIEKSQADESGAGVYLEGDTVTISAGDWDNHVFEGWTVSPDTVVLGNAQAKQTSFTMPGSSVKLAAKWKGFYSVTVKNSSAAKSGAGIYKVGDTVTIDAGAREGYLFRGWESSEKITFADPSRAVTTFAMPDYPVTVTAVWQKKATGTTETPSPENPSSPGTSQKPVQPVKKPGQNSAGSVSGPKTGDTAPTEWYFLSMVLSFLCCTIIYLQAIGKLKRCGRRRQSGFDN